jgi:hypothetical protein
MVLDVCEGAVGYFKVLQQYSSGIKSPESSVRRASNAVEILTRYVPNTSSNFYRNSNLLVVYSGAFESVNPVFCETLFRYL